MFEATGAAPDTELLYLAYEGVIKAEGTKVTVSVKGNFVGGTGRYKGATGQVELNSINGFFNDGRGTLSLQGAQKTAPVNSAPRDASIRTAVARYFEGTRSMDAARWASAFASNAIVLDPIAQPALTTPAQIRAQGDGFVSAFESVGLRERYVEINGDEAVAYWEASGKRKDGKTVRFEGINHFRFDESGKIVLLRGFWNPANMRVE
jgi:steroid Delta-isomerase